MRKSTIITLLLSGALIVGCGASARVVPDDDTNNQTSDSGSGSPEAGQSDSGGPSQPDAGSPESGPSSDSGSGDGGNCDDSGKGTPDAGGPGVDSGSGSDSGSDSGSGGGKDSGSGSDSGTVIDSGSGGGKDSGSGSDSGCGCGSSCSDQYTCCVEACGGEHCGNDDCLTACQSAEDTCLCEGVTCTSGETCQAGSCVCDGQPTPPSDDGGSCGGDSCGEGKTLLCHYPPGNPANRHNICVGDPSVPAHEAHGDTVGACP